MKEPTPNCHFEILRKDKIVLILKHKLLPHPKPTLTPTLFSQNFKMTGMCWFLHSTFESLGSSLVLLSMWRDLFGIFPREFVITLKVTMSFNCNKNTMSFNNYKYA